jgi:hypothetical protein
VSWLHAAGESKARCAAAQQVQSLSTFTIEASAV